MNLSADVSAGAAVLTLFSDDGTTQKTLWQRNVTAASPVQERFEDGLQADRADTPVKATLTAAGATNIGTVNLLGKIEQ